MTQEKNKKNRLTISDRYCNIVKRHLLERYRSGHNEAVLKTVCPNGHMGSNPILSAKDTSLCCINYIYHIGRYLFGEIPKRPKGLPWKGSRSGEPARGFKSLFLRLKR